MTDSPEPEYDADFDDGQPDPSDAVIAWYFGTRELTPEEYARFADSHRRDFARTEASNKRTLNTRHGKPRILPQQPSMRPPLKPRPERHAHCCGAGPRGRPGG